MTDDTRSLVLAALDALVPGSVTLRELHPDGPDPGGRGLRWVEAGNGVPPIVLVAGAGETALDWVPILPALARLSTVVALDRAGLGVSDPGPKLTLAAQLADLRAVLAAVGPAVVVGHSWGGLLVRLAAQQGTASIAGVVLIDPYHEEIAAALPLRLRIMAAVMGRAIVPLYLTGLMPRISRQMAQRLARDCTDDPAVRSAVTAAYVASYARRHQVAMIGGENRLGMASIAEVRRLRAPLQDVPLIVLTASSGKPAVLQRRSAQLAGELAAGVRQGRHIVVPGSGHYIHHDQPVVVADAVATVLAAACD
jgi:pimeloyl-ACP methyl ester carboxylesterase